jgi:hypothetical protein
VIDYGTAQCRVSSPKKEDGAIVFKIFRAWVHGHAGLQGDFGIPVEESSNARSD